jgi:hypothetical protein
MYGTETGMAFGLACVMLVIEVDPALAQTRWPDRSLMLRTRESFRTRTCWPSLR